MALAVCNRMAWLPLVQRDVDVASLEEVIIDGLEAIDRDGWKGTTSGFIPVDRFAVVFTAVSW